MHFDWTVSIGIIIHLVGVLIGLIVLYGKIDTRIKLIETKHAIAIEGITEIKSELKDMHKDYIKMLMEKINNIEIRLAVLESKK